jgi:hypothetical protein
VPSDSEVRDFLSVQRIFISSVMRSLRDERLAVASAIEAAGAIPVWFEEFGGRDSDPEAAYIAEVESSSVYVGILGREYGRIQKSRFSATHEEYLAAERAGLRISVWAVADGEWDGHQERFVNEVRTFHVTGSFRDLRTSRARLFGVCRLSLLKRFPRGASSAISSSELKKSSSPGVSYE